MNLKISATIYFILLQLSLHWQKTFATNVYNTKSLFFNIMFLHYDRLPSVNMVI